MSLKSISHLLTLCLCALSTQPTYPVCEGLGLAPPYDAKQVDRDPRGNNEQPHEALERRVEQREYDQEQHDDHEEDWEEQLHLQ